MIGSTVGLPIYLTDVQKKKKECNLQDHLWVVYLLWFIESLQKHSRQFGKLAQKLRLAQHSREHNSLHAESWVVKNFSAAKQWKRNTLYSFIKRTRKQEKNRLLKNRTSPLEKGRIRIRNYFMQSRASIRIQVVI